MCCLTAQDEVERGTEPKTHEVGIDIGAEALASQTSQTSQSGGGTLSQQSTGGGSASQTGLMDSQASQTSTGGGATLSVDVGTSQNSSDMEVHIIHNTVRSWLK